jgi:hypothetical protein
MQRRDVDHVSGYAIDPRGDEAMELPSVDDLQVAAAAAAAMGYEAEEAGETSSEEEEGDSSDSDSDEDSSEDEDMEQSTVSIALQCDGEPFMLILIQSTSETRCCPFASPHTLTMGIP